MVLLQPEFEHGDARRTLTQLLTADIKQVNLYTANKGSILGGHYHKETNEYFYLIKGKICYNEERMLETGDMFVVYPQEVHTLECLTDVKLMSFLSRPYTEIEPDTWKI